MTKQVTVKLNDGQFGPIIEELQEFIGTGVTDSHSDLVGKCLFFLHSCALEKNPKNGKTYFDTVLENHNMSRAEYILHFLNKYQDFKKNGHNGRAR